MKPLTIGLVAVVLVVILLVALVYMGFIRIPGLALTPDSEDAPPGAVYCDYTDMQILDMLETVAGKDLDNGVGVSFVRALNMQACGSDGESVSTIVSYYRSLYSEWYVGYDDSTSGAGWTARAVTWFNDADPSSATLAKFLMVGDGVTVKATYGYDTITVVGDGPIITYQAFILWVATS